MFSWVQDQKKKKKKGATEPGEALGSSPRQLAFQRCFRILERADRADVTATRGAAAGRIKGGLCALQQTASESAPEQHPRPPLLLGKDLDRRTSATRSPPRPSPPCHPARRTRRPDPAAPCLYAAHPCVGVFASVLARTPARHNELQHGRDARRRCRRHPPLLGRAGEFFCLRFPVCSPDPSSVPQIAHGRRKLN